MRNRLPFRCESCGDQPIAGHACARCRVALVDADGRRVAAPIVEIYPVPLVQGIRRIGWFLNIAIPSLVFVWALLPGFRKVTFLDWDSVLYLNKSVAVAGILWLFFAIPYWGAWLVLRALRGKARADERRASEVAAITSLTTIEPVESCKDGLVRVRGRVRVVSGVDLRGETVAAFRAREPMHAAASSKSSRSDSQVMDTCAGGRFLVVDETGAALVDDDALEVWLAGARPPTGELWSLVAREGDEVEIVGRGRWRAAQSDEIAALGAAAEVSYRAGPPRVFAFDGDLKARVLVLVDTAGNTRTKTRGNNSVRVKTEAEPSAEAEETAEAEAAAAANAGVRQRR